MVQGLPRPDMMAEVMGGPKPEQLERAVDQSQEVYMKQKRTPCNGAGPMSATYCARCPTPKLSWWSTDRPSVRP
ncbi:hypothetical protein B6S08_03510 [Oceanimonas doudoroffii]|uniref:Uncharacterized protein n=1 Tax=Oceanimonas doudoroffii TaxID=84158 RepID=A0A233RGT1_9GAMM|nr:hypothetical protein B6S08_03510 [Oceanimonas doudoroffii]